MTPFFSIITPTIQRDSLIECCASVDEQSFDSWEQIVWIDGETLNDELIEKIAHPNRKIVFTGIRYNNYGNTPRYLAWEWATGNRLLMLDDDNTLSHNNSLKQIAKALDDDTDFAIFPILRHGSIFFNDPPGLCMTDTANVIVKREIGRWPNIPDYTADGHWVETLKCKYNWMSFPDMLPIITMEKSSQGK